MEKYKGLNIKKTKFKLILSGAGIHPTGMFLEYIHRRVPLSKTVLQPDMSKTGEIWIVKCHDFDKAIEEVKGIYETMQYVKTMKPVRSLKKNLENDS